MLMFSLHCNKEKRPFQNKYVKRTSLSLITFFGSPCLQTTCSKNKRAVSYASISVVHGISVTNFEKRHTTVSTASNPRDVQGSAVTKSIKTTSNGRRGTLCRCNKPEGAYVEVLEAWHVVHSLQKRSMSFLMCCQKKRCRASRSILSDATCPPRPLACSSSMINRLRS